MPFYSIRPQMRIFQTVAEEQPLFLEKLVYKYSDEAVYSPYNRTCHLPFKSYSATGGAVDPRDATHRAAHWKTVEYHQVQ